MGCPETPIWGCLERSFFKSERRDIVHASHGNSISGVAVLSPCTMAFAAIWGGCGTYAPAWSLYGPLGSIVYSETDKVHKMSMNQHHGGTLMLY